MKVCVLGGTGNISTSIPNSDEIMWEDEIIAAQKSVHPSKVLI